MVQIVKGASKVIGMVQGLNLSLNQIHQVFFHSGRKKFF